MVATCRVLLDRAAVHQMALNSKCNMLASVVFRGTWADVGKLHDFDGPITRTRCEPSSAAVTIVALVLSSALISLTLASVSSTQQAEASASACMQLGATTDAVIRRVVPRPVRGSMMCE